MKQKFGRMTRFSTLSVRILVTPTLAGPGGRRPPGMLTELFPGSGGRDLAGGPHTRHGASGGTS